MKKALILGGGLILMITVGIVMRGDEETSAGSSEFDNKVAAKTATFKDWEGATDAEKRRFARAYAKAHLGREDGRRQMDIVRYLDSTVAHLKKRPIDPRAIETVLADGDIWTAATAGARVMGWPAPKE